MILSSERSRIFISQCHSRWSLKASRKVMTYSTSSVVSHDTGKRECDAPIIISQTELIDISISINSTLTRGVMTDSAVISERPRRFLICFFSSSSTAPHSCDISIKASTSSVVILLDKPLAQKSFATPFTKRLRRKESGERSMTKTLYNGATASAILGA